MIPVTADLKLLNYTGFGEDGDEQIMGLAFLYGDQKFAYGLEVVYDGRDRQKERQLKESFEDFRITICQILFTINECQSPFKQSKRDIDKYCTDVKLDFLMQQPDLFALFFDEQSNPQSLQKAQLKQKPASKKKVYTQKEVDQLMEKMSNLDFMKDEIKSTEEIRLNVL